MTRRRWLAVIATVVVVGLRAGLPEIVRRVAISQADHALVGRITLDDVDLGVLRGAVTLRGLGLHADELPAPDAPPPTDAPPAIVTMESFVVDVSWFALLRKTLQVEVLQLDGFDVRLDRAKDGAFVLPRPIPKEATEAEPEATGGSGWDILVDFVRFQRGRLGFRDFAVGDTPQEMEVAVDDVWAEKLALRFGDTGREEGRLRLKANIQGGTVAIDAGIAVPTAGPRVDAQIDLTGFPIGNTRFYIPKVGWSGLQGMLDAKIHHTLVTGETHRVSGTVALRDVTVAVPNVERPVLAWSKLEVDVEDIDLLGERAVVKAVTLDGLHALVRPREPVLLPVIAGLTSGDETPAAPAPDTPDAKPAAWQWTVHTVALRDGHLDVEGGPTPLDVVTTADVTGLSSAPDAQPKVGLQLALGDGTVAVDGTTALATPRFDGTVKIANLALSPVLAVVPQPAVAVIRKGTLGTDLTVAYGDGVRIAGQVDLGGIEMTEAPEFRVAWQRLGITAREVVVPLGAEARGPIRVVLDRVQLAQPAVRLTRTAKGLVLPKAFGGSDTAAPGKTPAKPSKATSAKPAEPAVDVRASNVAIERGQVLVEDRTVKPFFRNDIQPVDLKLASVQWPVLALDGMQLDLRTRGGGSLRVRGKHATSSSTIDLALDKWPLAPMNPYVVSSGYGLAGGTASLTSNVRLRGADYDAKNHILISKLDLKGAEGDSLFQQNFGISLSVALALLTDLQGNITFDVPVSGNQKGTKVPLGSIVMQALTKAILGAVTSPLKLLGAVADGLTGDGGSASPTTIGFVAGRTEPSATDAERVAGVAELLGRSPGLAIALRGIAGAEDARRLREDAVRAELERTSGVVGSVRYVAERAVRKDVLGYLTARDAGKDATLSAEGQTWLDAHVSATTLPATALTALATKRAAWLQQELQTRHGVDAARLTLAEPTANADDTAKPAVALELGAAAR